MSIDDGMAKVDADNVDVNDAANAAILNVGTIAILIITHKGMNIIKIIHEMS